MKKIPLAVLYSSQKEAEKAIREWAQKHPKSRKVFVVGQQKIMYNTYYKVEEVKKK